MLIRLDQILQRTNVLDDDFVKAESVYKVTLSLSPRIIYVPDRIKRPFFAATTGLSFAGIFGILRRSVMGRGHQTATFRLHAM